MITTVIHPSSQPLVLEWVTGVLESIPNVTGQEAGYNLDRSHVYRTETAHLWEYGQFRVTNQLILSLDGGRKLVYPEKPRENMETSHRSHLANLWILTRVIHTIRHVVTTVSTVIHTLLVKNKKWNLIL